MTKLKSINISAVTTDNITISKEILLLPKATTDKVPITLEFMDNLLSILINQKEYYFLNPKCKENAEKEIKNFLARLDN